MRRSLTRSLVVRCSMLAVLGLFAAVGEHFIRDGVELHYELDDIADSLAAAARPVDGELELVPDAELRAWLDVIPDLHLSVFDDSGQPLFTFGAPAAKMVEAASRTLEGYFVFSATERDDAQSGPRFGYVASRRASDGTALRIVAERAPATPRDRLLWVQAEIMDEYGPFMLVSAVLSILVVILTVKNALGPLARVSAEAASIVPGDGKRLGLESVPREIRPLVEAMNGALGRLQEALAREQRFTADVAHTLRTPLAALRARVEGSTATAERTALLRAIARIERLADQLLFKARLEAGTLDRFEVVDLGELVHDLAGEARPVLSREEKQLLVRTPREPVICRASRVAIEQALLNLLDNAAKAAPRGSVIDLVARADGTVLVCDRGAGFAESEIANLCLPFRRGATSRWQGAGLGLAIVAEAVQRNGGELVIRNREGGGAEVGFRIPLASNAKTTRKLAA